MTIEIHELANNSDGLAFTIIVRDETDTKNRAGINITHKEAEALVIYLTNYFIRSK